MEIQKSKRFRVNISTSVKGIKTWDCTAEIEGGDIYEVLAESDNLVGELESRYPPPVAP